jgi:hypothetical protein
MHASFALFQNEAGANKWQKSADIKGMQGV